MSSEALTGDQMPRMTTDSPGPTSTKWVDRLSRTECPAITARRARRERETGAGQDPIVWDEARGANVRDADGNVYVDMTAGFAVAGLGHRPPQVVDAARDQLDTLVHAMGDVYPSKIKIELCDRLADVAPGDLQQSILGQSGSDAVTAALKTAAVHTGKPGFLSFWGAYHGLAYGALSASAYREEFREPFLDQLNNHARHVPYPDPLRPPFGLERGEATPEEIRDACLEHIDQLLSGHATGSEGIGAIIVEPIQGRGGKVVPPEGFLQGLRDVCDRHDLVLIFDEIYTGFGRTGDLFACQNEGVVPDVLCTGKSMGGGAPMSAAIGRPEVMESWGTSEGEAIHTQTFLGNPLCCAMAKAAVDTIVDEDWPSRVRERGDALADKLESLVSRWPDRIADVRGRGMMWGLEVVESGDGVEPDGSLVRRLMDFCRQSGYLFLPSGTHGNVVGLTPPFVATEEQIDGFLDVFERGLEHLTERG